MSLVVVLGIGCFIAGLLIGGALVAFLALWWAESDDGRRAVALADAERQIQDLRIAALRDIARQTESVSGVIEGTVVDEPDDLGGES